MTSRRSTASPETTGGMWTRPARSLCRYSIVVSSAPMRDRASLPLVAQHADAQGARAVLADARARGYLYRNAWPAVGDIAFFHDTYDANRDGVRNDPITHAAVVADVQPDGTIVLISRMRGRL